MQNHNGQSAKGGPLRCKTVTNGVPRGPPLVQNRNERSAKGPVENRNERSAKGAPLRCKAVTNAGPEQAFRSLN